MIENSKDFWSKQWVDILSTNLKGYIEKDGFISELSSKSIISNLLEVNESINILENLSKQGIQIDYLSDINNIYLLTKECANKKNALDILFNNVSNTLASFLKSEGYDIGNTIVESKLTNRDRLRELEIAKFESILRNACNKKIIKLSKDKTTEELLDETASILVQSYYTKKAGATR